MIDSYDIRTDMERTQKRGTKIKHSFDITEFCKIQKTPDNYGMR